MRESGDSQVPLCPTCTVIHFARSPNSKPATHDTNNLAQANTHSSHWEPPSARMTPGAHANFGPANFFDFFLAAVSQNQTSSSMFSASGGTRSLRARVCGCCCFVWFGSSGTTVFLTAAFPIDLSAFFASVDAPDVCFARTFDFFFLSLSKKRLVVVTFSFDNVANSIKSSLLSLSLSLESDDDMLVVDVAVASACSETTATQNVNERHDKQTMWHSIPPLVGRDNNVKDCRRNRVRKEKKRNPTNQPTDVLLFFR